MLKMDQYEQIRTAHRVYGEGIKAIALRTGHSRNTVRKALRGTFRTYQPRAQQPYPVLGPFLTIIDTWLHDDLQHPRKQRHTAERIYQRLVAELGYRGCASTVRRYVREAKMRLGSGSRAVFIPLEPALGREAEVDWGTAYAVIDGVSEQLKYFCMRSKGSGKPFVRLYRCERQQAFFDALMRAFAYFGGIFPVLVFDNLTTAVRRVLQGKERQEQEGFQRFRSYYSFEARFCTPGAGHEKGGVEGLVGFVRRNVLVPVPTAETLEALNARLLAFCHAYGQRTIHGREATVDELFLQERGMLLPAPAHPFENVPPPLERRPDKYATIMVERNRYSVPTRLAGCRFQVLCRIDTVEFHAQGRCVTEHPRLYGGGKWQLNPDHYLDLLRQRPLAFDSARAIRQWKACWPPAMHQLLERFRQTHGQNHGTKEFIDVLLLFRDHPHDHVEAAITQALASGIRCSAGVRHLLHHQTPVASILPLEQYDRLPTADVSAYGALGGVR